MVLEEVDPMLTLNILVEKITKENENDIVWNERGRILDALIETGIAILRRNLINEKNIEETDNFIYF